jgi:hypothetical protein
LTGTTPSINTTSAATTLNLFNAMTSGTIGIATNLASNSVINLGTTASTIDLNLNALVKFRQAKWFNQVKIITGTTTLSFPEYEFLMLKTTADANITLPLIDSIKYVGLTFSFVKIASSTHIITLSCQGTNKIVLSGTSSGIPFDNTMLGSGYTYTQLCIMEQTSGNYVWAEVNQIPKSILNDKASLDNNNIFYGNNIFDGSNTYNTVFTAKNGMYYYDQTLTYPTNQARIYQDGQTLRFDTNEPEYSNSYAFYVNAYPSVTISETKTLIDNPFEVNDNSQFNYVATFSDGINLNSVIKHKQTQLLNEVKDITGTSETLDFPLEQILMLSSTGTTQIDITLPLITSSQQIGFTFNAIKTGSITNQVNFICQGTNQIRTYGSITNFSSRIILISADNIANLYPLEIGGVYVWITY